MPNGKIVTLAILMLLLQGMACRKELPLPRPYATKYVVVVVIDGPRYTETFGDSTHQYIPELYSLSQQGTIFTRFYNNGVTNTFNGIAAIASGNYQALANNGSSSPRYENFLHGVLRKIKGNSSNACIISSKDKIAALQGCTDCNNVVAPYASCGNDNLSSGYRSDSITNSIALQKIAEHNMHAMLLTYQEPDASGHTGNWDAYLAGIRSTSKYVQSIWNALQADSMYAGRTAMFVTNDHGRHLDGVADGFVSHGDACEGCKHISLVALGPDFKKGYVDNTYYEQIDIAATINYMLQLNMRSVKGNVITSLISD